ncbi:hypothetical protein KDW_32300 [Dictyobacter vulcani]|uniref:Uncharacterized protein n=1 Tax=Dictyobacter vulcani TaxID=2607529 RepID=A0A5J4KH61_9CHLR|nr:hypothetical protein [Dictyobacter vulcani]GER89068.1 hypothetical protein KDW_32300 [Dictyobacter vulcani]
MKILDAFLDTLYLNVNQTNASYKVIKKKLPDGLKLKLQQLKDQAQEESEDFSFSLSG